MIDRDGYAWEHCDDRTCTVCSVQPATTECVELRQALCEQCLAGLVRFPTVRRVPLPDAARRAMAAKRTQTAQGRLFQRAMLEQRRLFDLADAMKAERERQARNDDLFGGPHAAPRR